MRVNSVLDLIVIRKKEILDLTLGPYDCTILLV